MSNHPKLRLKTSSTCIDPVIIFELLQSKYDIVYCGIHRVGEEVYVYVHNRERMAPTILKDTLSEYLDIIDIEKFSSFEGDVIDKTGDILKHGGDRRSKELVEKTFTVSTRARKYMVNISSSVPPVSNDLFDGINYVYGLSYLGVYMNEGKMCIYIQCKNRIAIKNMYSALLDMDVDVDDLSVCKKFIGEEIMSEKGKRPRPGEGGRISKRSRLDLSAPQPATNLPEPKKPKKTSYNNSNVSLVHDDVYVNKSTVGCPPEAFHAVWSSTDGLWSPHMWVGPVRNIFPMPRGSIKPCVIEELFDEQDSKCRLCKTHVFMGTYSNSDVDHIIPLRHGGPCVKSNLQVLCVTCHRRKTALECKKVVTLMGSSDVNWGPDKVYIANTHIHYEPPMIRGKNPKAFLEFNGSANPVAGLFVLEY